MALHSEAGEIGADRREWSETKSDLHNTPTTQYSKIRVLLILWFKMQSNRAPWPKRNMLVKHCCYWWFEVNIKPVPRCHFVNYNIAEVYFDKLSQHLTTCSRLEDFTRAWTSLALWFLWREGIRPTKTNAQYKTKATHLRCVSDQIKAAPCTAFLSYFNFGGLRTVARLQEIYCDQLATCTVAQGPAAEC